uniref:Uncharacterized protein n=1 Tax=Vitis vinifera TaxID=29760 RepID=F6HB15_VITVI
MEIALEWKRKKPHDWQDFVGIITLLFKNSTGSFIKENNVGEGCWVLMALSANECFEFPPDVVKLISGIMMFPLSLRHANNYAATHGRMKPPSKH